MSEKEVLSEGEIDALMDSYSGEEGAEGAVADGQGCKVFDFSTREQTLLAQMPALKKLNEKHCMALAQGIGEMYGISAQVDVPEVKLIKLDQALAGIADPSAINLVKIAPLNGMSYVVLAGDLLSFFVDSYFGGARGGATFARHSLTPTELRINEVLTERFLATLVDAWLEKVSLTPQLSSFETKPTFLQASSPDELAMMFSFVITVGEWNGSIDWLVPYASLEPLRAKLGSLTSEVKPAQKNRDWEEHFRRELQSVALEVTGSFESGQVSIAEVLKLKAGSILPLKMPTNVTVCIEEQAFSYGEHGVLNGHKSIKIKEFINHETDSA